MIHDPDPHGNAWTSEVRRQAWIALEIAATRHEDARHALGYYVRTALAHGFTVAEVCRATDLAPATVRGLSDPGMAA